MLNMDDFTNHYKNNLAPRTLSPDSKSFYVFGVDNCQLYIDDIYLGIYIFTFYFIYFCTTRPKGGYLSYQDMTISELKACTYCPGSDYL